MASKTICFGFDGICADMSFLIPELPKFRSELLIKYPFLEPVFDIILAERPEDCELQFESTELGFETFFDCIFTLNEINRKKTTRIGGNAAIETVTAINLLKEPTYPINYVDIHFLGNYSVDVSQKLPKEQRIAPEFLDYANHVKTSYTPISIIIPHKLKRAIISFAGIPAIRRIESFKTYMKNLVPIIEKLNPDLMAILGAANVFATTMNFNDFRLLDPFLNMRCAAIDLGGKVGWDHRRLKHFYQAVDKAKMVIGNDEEFKDWYNFKFGESIRDTDPLTLYKMVDSLRKANQIAVCHTQYYQFVIGLEGEMDIIKAIMNFANRATVVKTNLERFPTAKEIEEVILKEKSFPLPAALEAGAIVTRSIDQEIINPVGLGDVWSCTFNLGLLSQNII